MSGPSCMKGNDMRKCKICEEVYPSTKAAEHKTTYKHIQAQRKKCGEDFCPICKDKFFKAYWKDHEKCEIHTLIQQRLKNKKVTKETTDKKEKYEVREAWGENQDNQQYINTLTTFLVLRCAFKKKKFKASINNAEFGEFGDIVIELIDDIEIEAIRCKKGSHRNNYTMSALSEESRKLSLREQLDIIKRLKEQKNITKSLKKQDTMKSLNKQDVMKRLKEEQDIMKSLKERLNFEKTCFNLYTVSSLVLDTFRFCYDEEIVRDWKNNKEVWKGRQVEIKQYKSESLLNTNDDSDDICIFKIMDAQDGEIYINDEKFRMYINQKQVTDLKLLIKTMIHNYYNIGIDISDQLVMYVKEYFRTDKLIRKNEFIPANSEKKDTFKKRTDKLIKKSESSSASSEIKESKSKKIAEYNFKMTGKDILLKIAEVLLLPYLLIPETGIEEKHLEMWNKIVSKFDLVIMKSYSETVNNIYSSIHQILTSETNYSLNALNRVIVDKNNIKNVALKSTILENPGYDGSLKFMYLALWKTELTPLVLKAETVDQLVLISKVISFLKNQDIILKFVIFTDLSIDHSYFPETLIVYLNGADLRLMDDDSFQALLKSETHILNFKVSLKEIIHYNMDFLEKLTPDTLLNIFLEEFSFKDVHVPLTARIRDYTMILGDEAVEKIGHYFEDRGETMETEFLSYVISAHGQPICIQVPPKL